MESEIYIAKRVAGTIESAPHEQQEEIASLIDSLRCDGWKSSQVLGRASLQGEPVRIAGTGEFSIVFTYNPDRQTIIVTDVVKSGDLQPYVSRSSGSKVPQVALETVS